MPSNTKSSSSAERTAELLIAFGTADSANDSYSVSALARSVGRERSQVSRMLKALERGGLVEQDPESRSYRLTWQMQVLAARSGRRQLLQATQPALRFLAAKTEEVALLSVEQGGRSLTVARADANRSLQAGGWVGRSSPLHCTASGRALLFDSPPDLVELLTAEEIAGDRGPGAFAGVAQLHERLAIERARGYSTAIEEVEVGLSSVGVPVRGLLGEIVGAINVSGPTSRLRPRIEEVTDLLRASATQIAAVWHKSTPAMR